MNVVIAGSGISGLAAAISLRRCGHKVTIYEKSSMNNEIGAAINVPPNAARILVPWGLDPVKAGFIEGKGIYFMSPTTNEQLNFVDQSDYAEVYGQGLWYAHRVDLHESLKQMATAVDGPGVPAKIIVKSGVINYDPETPSVTLNDGSVVDSDLIVAADGVHSVSVESILGHANPPKQANSYNCCYRFLIPTADVEADPETSFFTSGIGRDEVRIWADNGNRRRIVSYYCRDYKILNFVVICYNENMDSTEEDWHASIDRTEVLERYTGFHAGILAVMNKATDVKRWPLLYRPPIPAFYKSNMAIIGDAAHPMLPNLAQGGAQGMEDGAVLGLVMHGATNRSQIEERLALYSKIRYYRASSIQILSNFGYDELDAVSDELTKYLGGAAVPANPGETLDLTFRPDVVKRTVEEMKAIDGTFKIPDDFFQPIKSVPN